MTVLVSSHFLLDGADPEEGSAAGSFCSGEEFPKRSAYVLATVEMNEALRA